MPDSETGSKKKEERTLRLPVLPLYETVVFPRMMQPIQVGRKPSLLAVDEAVKQRPHRIVMLTQTDSDKQDVGPDDLMDIGVMATLGPMLRLPDGSVQLLAQGEERVRVLGFSKTEPYLEVEVEIIQQAAPQTREIAALMQSTKELITNYVNLRGNVPADALSTVRDVEDPAWLAEVMDGPRRDHDRERPVGKREPLGFGPDQRDAPAVPARARLAQHLHGEIDPDGVPDAGRVDREERTGAARNVEQAVVGLGRSQPEERLLLRVPLRDAATSVPPRGLGESRLVQAARICHGSGTIVRLRAANVATSVYPAARAIVSARSKSRPTSSGVCASELIRVGTPARRHAARNGGAG